MGGLASAAIGAAPASGRGVAAPVRQALLVICLAAAALAGDDRPAGASQLCKAGSFAPGFRSEASRPQRLRPASEGVRDQTAVRGHPRPAAG